MNSDDEDALKDEHGEELPGMYAPGCTSLDQVKLSAEQAQAQRAGTKGPPRSQTPVGSSDDDDPNGEELIWSQTKHLWRPNKGKQRIAAIVALTSQPMSVPELEPKRQPTPLTSPANSDDEGMSEDQRRMANLGKKMA
jgi:hypothetical protein